ncbi:MAG TPA: glycosyltransferase [Candidatus Limnocylindria bacterium]|nr:glycosyltransferase [Candidatus Limnocylindria bacterium]
MKIALATIGTTGDVVPFVALARGMTAAGHEVTAVSWELHRTAFEGAASSFLPTGPPTSRDEIAETASRAAAAGSPLAQVAVLRDFHLRDAADHYRHLREVLPGHDLVVLHGIHTLAEAAVRDAGQAWASAVFDPVLLPTAAAPPAGMPSLGPLNRVEWWILDRMLRRQDKPLRAVLESAGSSAARQVTMFRARSPRLHLVGCSPRIAPPPTDLASNTHFTGAWTDPTPPASLPQALDQFLAAGPPPVVVTFGSMAAPDPAALASAVVSGIHDAGHRVVLQGVPAMLDGDDVLSVATVDHRALFPRAAAVIHHGGAGTTHTAVASGVPSLVIPHVGDQPFWAMRLHQLGVAPSPLAVKAVTVDEVRERVAQASAEPMRSAAARLGKAVSAEGGVRTAIGLIERALETPAA